MGEYNKSDISLIMVLLRTIKEEIIAMSILSYNYQNQYLNLLHSQFLDSVKHIKEPHYQTFDISNYVSIIESLGSLFQEFCRHSIIESFSEIDLKFKNSELRKRDYFVHDKRERTIITVFGVVTFSRTIYKDRSSGKSFTYLDRKLGLPRWDKYDPCIKAMVFELYADQNSMIKVGSIIGDRIYSPFSKSIQRHQFNLSRQTVYNIVRNSLLTKHHIKQCDVTPKTLYILADEKFVHTQREDKDAMVKAAVIFEEIVSKGNRNELVNKTVYASLDRNFWADIYDIICEKYDVELIENIYILGDGARWIKSGIYILPRCSFILDKFHYKQSINRITKDKSIQSIVHSNIINNQKDVFQEIVDAIKESTGNESRIQRIIQNKDYILNNWNAIQDAHHTVKVGCSMESAISHMFASVFTNRPKAYKRENLKRYLNTRIQFLSRIDLRQHYLETLTEERKETYFTPKETFDLSMFEERTGYDKSSTSNWLKGFISQN